MNLPGTLELLSHDQFRQLLDESIVYIVDRLKFRQDAAFVVRALLEFYSLRVNNATLTENFYGLKRVSNKSGIYTWLLAGVIMPRAWALVNDFYMHKLGGMAKLQGYSNAVDEALLERKSGKIAAFLTKAWPWIHTSASATQLAYTLLYLAGKTNHWNLKLHLTRTLLQRNPSPTDPLSPKSENLVLKWLMPILWLSLRSLDWWQQNSERIMEAVSVSKSKNNSEITDVAPPEVYAAETDYCDSLGCIICKKGSIASPTQLLPLTAGVVSSVYCDTCIRTYLLLWKRCPKSLTTISIKNQADVDKCLRRLYINISE